MSTVNSDSKERVLVVNGKNSLIKVTMYVHEFDRFKYVGAA